MTQDLRVVLLLLFLIVHATCAGVLIEIWFWPGIALIVPIVIPSAYLIDAFEQNENLNFKVSTPFIAITENMEQKVGNLNSSLQRKLAILLSIILAIGFATSVAAFFYYPPAMLTCEIVVVILGNVLFFFIHTLNKKVSTQDYKSIQLNLKLVCYLCHKKLTRRLLMPSPYL